MSLKLNETFHGLSTGLIFNDTLNNSIQSNQHVYYFDPIVGYRKYAPAVYESDNFHLINGDDGERLLDIIHMILQNINEVKSTEGSEIPPFVILIDHFEKFNFVYDVKKTLLFNILVDLMNVTNNIIIMVSSVGRIYNNLKISSYPKIAFSHDYTEVTL